MLRILVLGSAAGGGFPQWNCRCPTCQLAWDGDARVAARTQSSLAVSTDSERWFLLNASPDLRQQVLNTRELHPRHGARDSPIAGVVLTNGDVDHIAGLLSLRERQPFVLYGSAAILALIADDPVFAVLDPASVDKIVMRPDQPLQLSDGLICTPFLVPGKVPLFLETDDVAIGTFSEMTIGLDLAAGGRRAVYVPGCARVEPSLLARLAGADVLIFDGTTYTDDEMIRLGLSPKTAARMGHLAMSGAAGSMAALAGADVGRKVYIHINNTNPALVEGSPERHALTAAGWDLAFDGMEIAL